MLFLGYGDGPMSVAPPLTGLCAPVVTASPQTFGRSSAASSAFRNSSALFFSSLSSLVLRFISKLYFDLLRKQQNDKRRASKPRRERPPTMPPTMPPTTPPTTVEKCGLLRVGGITVADEVCFIHEEVVLLESVIVGAVAAVA